MASVSIFSSVRFIADIQRVMLNILIWKEDISFFVGNVDIWWGHTIIEQVYRYKSGN